MIVRFPLSKIYNKIFSWNIRKYLDVVGSSSYVVMDTDYDNHAMVCTCQDMDLFFTFAHRRSALDIYNICDIYNLHIYISTGPAPSSSGAPPRTRRSPRGCPRCWTGRLTRPATTLTGSSRRSQHDLLPWSPNISMLLPNILWTNDTFQGCEYNKEKVLNIDVDKILGLKGNSEVNFRYLSCWRVI